MSAGTNGKPETALDNSQTEGSDLPSVHISYPFSRPHFDKFLRSISYTAAYPGNYGSVHLSSVYGFDAATARNAIAIGAKEGGQDFLLMLDNDCYFHHQALERMISHNLPIVCGCMFTRTIPPRPTTGRYVGQSKDGTHIYEYAPVARAILAKAREHGITHENAENNMLFPQTDTDLFEIDGCGMHFTLIRKDVLEAMKPPYFMFMGSTTAGEDYYFCRKAKELGFSIHLDLSVQTGHIDSEEHDYGIKELLFLTKYVDLERDILNVDSWEIGK